ncbi:hypothetical protein [Ruegeria sp. HKCCA5763]|uniref:Mom family adenine methylcarbamoylation protein n=1 Tax=Ruegeria sp. HKCCA5763 TaxID=2682987 RepID=UPI001488EC86|nr:hypothetical protein [Ruegeria sp. HKCCA5763]
MMRPYYLTCFQSRDDTVPIVERHHYTASLPSTRYHFGLFNNFTLVGVAAYGKPATRQGRLICGPEYEDRVLELKRVALIHNKPHEASRLIGGSLRLLRREVGDAVVVSYADTNQGHRGTIYQASNWDYFGTGAIKTDVTVKGLEHLHPASIMDEFRGQTNRTALLRAKYGDRVYSRRRPAKHRYATFVGSHRFKREARAAMRHAAKPYPGGSI